MNALRSRLGDREAGFSLVELLVAMVITGMVLGLAGTFFANIARITTASNTSRTAVGQAELAIDTIRNAVTMAADNPTTSSATTPAVVAGTSTTLTVISYSDTSASSIAPTSVTFALDANGYLVQTRQTGVLASTGYWAFTGTTTTRTIAGPFLTTGTSFFSYIDSSGTALALSSGALPTASLTKVAFVRVTPHITSRSNAGAAQTTVLTTTIGLTNLYRDISASVTLPTLSGGQ